MPPRFPPGRGWKRRQALPCVGTALGGSGIRIGTDRDATEARLRQLARAEAAVADLGRRALEGAGTEELMNAAVESVVGMLGVDLAAVFELRTGGDELEIRAAFGFTEDVVGETVPGGASSLAGFTINENAPVVVHDLAAERRFKPYPAVVRQGVQSELAVPLRGRPRAFGVLVAYSLERRTFGEDEVNLLRSAGNVLAAAIARWRTEDSLRQVNSLLHGVIEGSSDAVFVKDVQGRYLLVNSAGARVMGRTVEEVTGSTTAEVFGEEAAAALDRNDEEVIRGEQARTFEETVPVDGSEHVFLSAKSPYFDGDGRVAGIIGIARDITRRKQEEERQRFLAQASAALDTSLDPGETLQTIANLAVPVMADLCVIDLMEEDGALHGVAVAGVDPGVGERLIELRQRFPIDPEGGHPVAQVLRDGRAQLFRELEHRYAEIAQSDEHLAFAREMDYRSAVVAPLVARGRILGAISLIRTVTTERYSDHEVELARDLGRRAAMALANARLYAHEHDVSETLQRSLLPERFPEFPGLRFAARYLPGGPGVGVGGDWYDVLPVPGGRVGLAMGDVAGRGLRAASVMGQLRTTLRVYAAGQAAPGAILANVDRLFQRFEAGEMATLLLLVLDPAGGGISYSAAAHPPPLVLTPQGDAQFLEDGRGLPLGVAPAPRFQDAQTRLEPGSTVLLYTDGLVERPGESIDEGFDRLRAVTRRAPADPGELVDYVLAEMLDDSIRPDDVALLAVHMTTVASELKVELAGPRDDLASLREELRVWLGRHQVAVRQVEDIILACSEATANAMEHAYGQREGPIEVRGRRESDRIVVSVCDSGQWRPARADERGRGLDVIDAMMDSVEILKHPGGTEVRMVRRV
jgi:PAS domain S-box-containing protein